MLIIYLSEIAIFDMLWNLSSLWVCIYFPHHHSSVQRQKKHQTYSKQPVLPSALLTYAMGILSTSLNIFWKHSFKWLLFSIFLSSCVFVIIYLAKPLLLDPQVDPVFPLVNNTALNILLSFHSPGPSLPLLSRAFSSPESRSALFWLSPPAGPVLNGEWRSSCWAGRAGVGQKWADCRSLMRTGREERSQGPPQELPGLYQIFRTGELTHVESRRKETPWRENQDVRDKRSKIRWKY